MNYYSNYISHHGIMGQRWGIRRYQNPDGTLTPEGRKRYGSSDYINPKENFKPSKGGNYKSSDVVFISGKVSYDEKLPKTITDELDRVMKSNAKIIVGDAPGADTRAQEYLRDKNYNNVEVYTTDSKVRNNVGNWKVKTISDNGYKEEREIRRQKDIAMTNDSTKGIVISFADDKDTSATSLNIQRLIEQNKGIQFWDFKSNELSTNELFNQHIDLQNQINLQNTLNQIHIQDLLNQTINEINMQNTMNQIQQQEIMNQNVNMINQQQMDLQNQMLLNQMFFM